MMQSLLRKWKNSLQKSKIKKKIMENDQTKWKSLKYEIRKSTIDYSKTITKIGKKTED